MIRRFSRFPILLFFFFGLSSFFCLFFRPGWRRPPWVKFGWDGMEMGMGIGWAGCLWG